MASNQVAMSSKKRDSIIFKTVIYIVCIILALLSIWPFLNMLINSTRSTAEITSTSISLVPSKYMADNIKKLNTQKMFKPLVGLKNSFIISTCVTVLCSLVLLP